MTISQELEQYIEKHSTSEDLLLTKIYRETNIRMINPRMVSGHIQGLFLTLIAKMLKPDLILEIGTYTGYSTICLAKGLVPEGKIHTIEINDELGEVAKGYFKETKLENKIQIHIGNAISVIPELNLKFDLIYIDGEKREYTEYYKICVPYIKPGGYLLADNVLWNGKVVEPLVNDPATKAVLEFNRLISNDPRFENVLLPLRDGLMMAHLL